MKSAEFKKCEKKGCNNPVIVGKYCEHCKQLRKENKQTILAFAGTAVIAVGVFLGKKAIKTAPTIAAKVIQIVLKR